MTSTLPNISANSPAAAANSNSISSADLNPAGAAPATGTRDFADLLSPPVDQAPAQTVGSSASTPSSIQAMCVNAADAVAGAEAVEEKTDHSDQEVSRDTLEQAAAFVAGLMQTLLPEVAMPALIAGGSPIGPTATAQPELCPPANNVEGTASAGPGSTDQATARRELCRPSDQLEGPSPDGPRVTDQAASAPEAPAENFQVAYAADGSVEITLDLPPAKNTGAKADPASTPVEIHAELELPGQAVMRLQASGSFSSGDPAQTDRANFAGKKERSKTGTDSLLPAGERNFVFTGDKRVKTASPLDGISVAKTDVTMPSATLDETRATSSPVNPVGLAARGEFSVAWPSAERVVATPAAPVEANFAERAVATVTGLVDAQFSASMQKSGSVQLKLKFGGEDLTVRVELRGESVHTNFRTDSAELRAALTHEMQVVASQSPEQARRYLAPVFSPSSPLTPSSDSFPQPGRHQAATQQDLSQRQPRQPQPEEVAPFARRSLLRETFFPEPVAPRAPVLLPTSLRLSALA